MYFDAVLFCSIGGLKLTMKILTESNDAVAGVMHHSGNGSDEREYSHDEGSVERVAKCERCQDR